MDFAGEAWWEAKPDSSPMEHTATRHFAAVCPQAGRFASLSYHVSKCQRGDRSCPDCPAELFRGSERNHVAHAQMGMAACSSGPAGSKELAPGSLPTLLTQHGLRRCLPRACPLRGSGAVFQRPEPSCPGGQGESSFALWSTCPKSENHL